MKSTMLKNLYIGAKSVGPKRCLIMLVTLITNLGAGALLPWGYHNVLLALCRVLIGDGTVVTLCFIVACLFLLLFLTLVWLCMIPDLFKRCYVDLLEAIKLEEAIECNHGDTLAEVAKNIRKSSIEYRAVFIDEKNKLAEGTLLSSKECNIHCDKPLPRRCIDLHNHPSGRAGFSANDFKAAGCIQARLAIVVTKDVVCSVRYPENFWKEHPGQELKDYYNDLYESTRSVLLSRDAIVDSQYCVMINQLVANHFGLEFHCESFKEWYKANSVSKKKRLDPLFGRPTQERKTDP